MSRVWILDTETKGTGAHVAPLEKASPKPEPRRRRRRSEPPSEERPRRPARKPAPPPQTMASPLPAGHVRKKATGEIGRVQSVDAKAGTATVRWLRGGTTSTVPLSALARR
jgi:hypothetical protein